MSREMWGRRAGELVIVVRTTLVSLQRAAFTLVQIHSMYVRGEAIQVALDSSGRLNYGWN